MVLGKWTRSTPSRHSRHGSAARSQPLFARRTFGRTRPRESEAASSGAAMRRSM
jgi:hypothetical protein